MEKNKTIRSNKLLLLFVMLMLMTSAIQVKGAEITEWDNSYFTHGSGLSESQLVETKRLLGLPEDQKFTEIVVNGSDYKQFTGRTMSDASMYSSAIVEKTKKGSGVQVYINTPGNITQIKDHQYMNAALTSGITDCNIVVGSPIPVTGESALIGVYKAFEDAGYELDEEATKVATDELSMVNEISQDNDDNPDFDSKDFSLAMNEMKKQISELADKGSVTIEEINIIVTDVLNKNNISISEANKEKLISWLNDFKELDIDWSAIKKELGGLGNLLSKKAGEVFEWGQETGFFAKLWESLKSLYRSIFN